MILKFLITIYYIKRIAKFLFSYSQMSNWNYRKRFKTKPPCVTKDFHLRSSCDSPRYTYNSIVKAIFKSI